MPLKNLKLSYYYQVLYVSPHSINDGLSDKGYSSVAPSLSLPVHSLICNPTKQSSGVEMLFSLQILLEIFFKKSGVINFASHMNFKQIFESLFFMNKKQILDTYVFCNNYLKYSFINFQSIFSSF